MNYGHVVYSVSEGERFATDYNLEVVTCHSCRMVYAITATLASSARAYPSSQSDGWKLCCPLGHEWYYVGESVSDKLKREQQRVRATRDLLEHEQRSHAATRGHLTRQKRRVAAGTCPCCNRTFQQLSRHMKTKHPGFVEQSGGRFPADVPKPEPEVGHADVVLSFLAGGQRRWSEIRDHLGLPDSTTGNLIARLHAEGLIERVARGIYRKPIAERESETIA